MVFKGRRNWPNKSEQFLTELQPVTLRAGRCAPCTLTAGPTVRSPLAFAKKMKTQTIKRLFAAVAVPAAMVMTCACQERLADNAEAAITDRAAEIGKWEAAGWRYEETVGEEIPEASSGVHLSSDSARVIGAVARGEDGELIEKGFPQDEKLFLVVTMSGGQRGTYCLVFSKPKPPNRVPSTD